jgi:MoaA/NifB/PqqE/SkfB family radical SAM enzyme
MTETITARIDAVTKIPATHLRADPPAPKAVKIELTGLCNYLCSFCALRTREHQPKTDMDFDLFKRITSEMRASGVEEIGLFYLGESFMRPELLLKALQWVKGELRFPYVFLTSNGSLADSEEVEALMAAGLDSLKWSVNAADEEQFKDIMGVSPKYFRKALRNIKEAHRIRNEKGYKTRLYASSIKYDGEQSEKMEALLSEHVRPFVDESYFLPLYQMGMYADRVKDATGYSPTHGNSGRIDNATGLPNRKPIPCWSAFSEGHVRHDGHLSVCCFGSDDRFDAGDLNTQHFMEAWNSLKFQEIRAAHLRAATEGTTALRDTMCAVCVAWGDGGEKSR